MPATDAGVIVQLTAVLVLWLISLWALRNRSDDRLSAIGSGLVVVGLIGVRAIH